jgi:hypothetical protein
VLACSPIYFPPLIITYLTYICWEMNNFVIKVIFLGDFSFVRIFLTENYRLTMTTSSVVGIPTGGTFIPRDISVGILKPRGCSYHCDTGM